MDTLSREALLAAAAATALPREVIDIPDLGGKVIVQGMSGAQRDAWEISLVRGRGKKRRVDASNARARLAVRCIVKEDGTRVFSDEDAAQLGRLPAHILQPIYEAAQRLSGVSDEDVDDLEQPSGSEAGSGSPTS